MKKKKHKFSPLQQRKIQDHFV